MQDLPGDGGFTTDGFIRLAEWLQCLLLELPLHSGHQHDSPDKDRTASITLGAGAVVMDGEVIKGKCRQILQTQTNRKKAKNKKGG